MKKKLLLFLAAAFLLIQFFQPEKNTNRLSQPYRIAAHYDVPEKVGTVLKKACNDCHSNHTNYPWYASVQPIAWWLNDHIQEGKKELNFDEFASYGLKKQDHKLEELIEEIKKNNMPLRSYTRIHANAELKMEEKNTLIQWAEKTRKDIQAKMLVAGERKTP